MKNNNNLTNNNVNFDYKCYNIKYLLDDIYKLFKSIGIFDEFTFYLDNLSTINYIFSNDTNKIMFFCSCVNDIRKFIPIQIKLKELIHKNNQKFKYISMVSNYYSSLQLNNETNTNRQYDSLSFLYKFNNIDKQIVVTIYFFNSITFFNEQKFNNLICEDFFYNTRKLFISSVYYCVNDGNIYLIYNGGCKHEINGVNKIINISIHHKSENDTNNNINNDNNNNNDNVIDYDLNTFCIFDFDEEIDNYNEIYDINEDILFSNPDIFFDIFSYYLMTRDYKFKNNLSNIIWLYSNNKNIKKKFKKQFDYTDVNFNIKLYILVNLIKNFSLNQICLDIIKEFPQINKILFGLNNELNFFDIDIYSSFEIYVITILFNRHKVFKTKTYLNYIKKNCSGFNSSDGSNSSDFNLNFNSVFENKLEILRNIKKNIFSINYLNIPSKYYHFNKINCLCEILYVLLYSTKELNSNIEILKLSYIFKKFYFININDLNYVFDIYNQVIKNIGLDNKYFISTDNYFYTIYTNKKLLIEMEGNILSDLTKVNKNYLCSFDTIDIYDIQDSIYFVWELLYLNKLDLTDKIFLKLNVDEYHTSILANIRSNKLLYNHTDNDFNNLNTVLNNGDLINQLDLNEITKKYKKKYKINNCCVEEIIDLNNIYLNNNDYGDNSDIENNMMKMFNMFVEDFNSESNSNSNFLASNYYDDKDDDENNENIRDYFVDYDKDLNKTKTKNIFNKFTNSIDDIIGKINYFCREELSDTSDDYENTNISDTSDTSDTPNTQDTSDLGDLGELYDFDQNMSVFAENKIFNSKKELKYLKYKNKYVRLKNIYQIIQNDYFNINIFIDQLNLGLSNNQIFDSILDYYGYVKLTNCDDNEQNIFKDTWDKDNIGSCVINLNDINPNPITSTDTNSTDTNSIDTNSNNYKNINEGINSEIKKEIQTIINYLVENIFCGINNNINNNKICVQILNEIIDKVEFNYTSLI